MSALDATKLNTDTDRFYANLSELPAEERIFMWLYASKANTQITSTKAFVQFAHDIKDLTDLTAESTAESERVLKAAGLWGESDKMGDADRYYANLKDLPEVERVFMMLFAIHLNTQMTETRAFVKFAHDHQHVQANTPHGDAIYAMRPELMKP